MKSVLLSFFLFLSFLWGIQSLHAADLSYVGSDACSTCHESEHTSWLSSHHAMSMLVADESNVLGDFNEVNVSFGGTKTTFFRKGSQFYIKTLGENNQYHTYLVAYTFGFYPLQQYLLETENGHYQAFNIAWDSRVKKEGGQRWFHLRDDELQQEDWSAEHPFFWSRHFQNWNSRCADCHSTGLVKNYDESKHAYDTQFAEINVSCEACHGPASEHLQLVESKGFSADSTGFSIALSKSIDWAWKEGESIAKPIDNIAVMKKRDAEVTMCGGCHSLRTTLTENTHAHYPKDQSSYHDQFAIQMIQSPFYFTDGQIQEEVFVLGSFLQSKMYEKGVTCSNCHNPHSGELVADSQSVCAQCHLPTTYNVPSHHRHAEKSEGSLCVNCHMPETTYMGVDPRKDHMFGVPEVPMYASTDNEVPIACDNCHQKELQQDPRWTINTLNQWVGKLKTSELKKENKSELASANQTWTAFNQQISSADVLVTRTLSQWLEKEETTDMRTASLLLGFSTMPSKVSVELAKTKLDSQSPLIRSGAVRSLQTLPFQLKWQILSNYLDEPVGSVRFYMAEALQDGYGQLSGGEAARLNGLLDEYRQSLEVSKDSPATQVALANLALYQGRYQEAEKHYQQALIIENQFVPALLNYADFNRRSGRISNVEPLLAQAVKAAPDDGATHHAYGLYLVRNKAYKNALVYLENATKAENTTPRYAYVYAIALENQNQLEKAIKVLQQTEQQFKNQYDVLMLIIQYLEKAQRASEVYPYLSKISAIAPAAPEVKALIQKYGRN